MADEGASPIGKQVVVGGVMLVLALVLWELRDVVPWWLGRSFTATAEFSTTSERNDVRAMRAFAEVRRTVVADASFEPLPNPSQVRHTRLTVTAPTGDAAVDLVTRMSADMQKAFARGGEGEFLVNVRRRAELVSDATTDLANQALKTGAAGLAVLGFVLVALAVVRLQAGADRIPPPILWGIGFGLGLPVAVELLPGAVVAALFFMAIPTFLAALIVWKIGEVREAATWPSTNARIVRSVLRKEQERHGGEVTTVRNLPHVEYEFTLGGKTIRGTRIGIGEIPDDIQATLDHYRVGAIVPVYYDPKDPSNALLERGAPLSIAALYGIAAGIFVVGLAVLALFWNLSSIFDGLAGLFPSKAFLPGVAFFGLGGVMILMMLWAALRQTGQASFWPQVAGRIVSSTVEQYRDRVGGAQTGQVVIFHEAVVEYAYSVNGREYHSTQLSLGGKAAGSQASAAAKAARYRVGGQVMVHYNPKNPGNAVLEVRIAHGVTWIFIAVAFLGAALFFSGAFR